MSTDLATLNTGRATPATPIFSPADIDLMAERVAASRLFPGIETKQAAFALMLLCQAEGLHPANAVRRYHIIEGKPSMRADAMQAEFQRQGGKVRWVESTAARCEADFSHPQHAPEPVKIIVTFEELSRAGITNGKYGVKDNWKKFPRQMLRARAISEGVRMVMPGVVCGIYTPEEVQDFDPPRPAEPPPASYPEPAALEAPRATSSLTPGGSPETDRVFEGWCKAYLDKVEQHWADYWFKRLDWEPLDVGDCLPSFRLRNHLVKWLGGDVSTMKHNHITRMLSTAFAADPLRIKAEAKRYLQETVFPERVAAVEKRFALGPDGETGIEDDGAELVSAEDYGGDEPGEETQS